VKIRKKYTDESGYELLPDKLQLSEAGMGEVIALLKASAEGTHKSGRIFRNVWRHPRGLSEALSSSRARAE